MKTMLRSSLVNVEFELPESAGETVQVSHAHVAGADELAALIDGEWEVVRNVRTVVVDAAGRNLSDGDVQALGRLATWGVRVVAVSPRPVRHRAPLTLLHEREFARAAITSIYALAPGQSAVLITQGQANARRVPHLVRHALKWRASWQDCENGDFSGVPS